MFTLPHLGTADVQPNMLMSRIHHRLARLTAGASLRLRYHVKRRSGHAGASDPIFIVGCGHSGTSLLLAVLGSHSKLYAVPYESGLFVKSISARERLRRAFDQQAIGAGKIRWIEKTPHHVRYLDSILSTYTDAQVINMLRDGRDVACSIRQRVGSLEAGARRWLTDVTAAEGQSSDERVLTVRYDDLISDFSATLRAIGEFLAIDYEESMEHFHRTPKRYYASRIARPDSPRDHCQYRNWQINQPLFDGRGRWTREMSPEDKVVFKAIAGHKLIETGYAIDNDW